MIRDNLSVKPLQPSNVIQITLKYRSALEAAQIVNTLVSTLIAENQDSRKAKIDEAINYVTSSLANIQDRLGQTSRTVRIKSYNPKRIAALLKETEDELGRVDGYLNQLIALLNPSQRKAVESVLASQQIRQFRSTLAPLESTLIADLQNKNWNHPTVKQDQQIIWREKARLTASLKTILNQDLNSFRVQNLDDFCAYQIKHLELELRRTELQGMSGQTVQQPGDTQATTLKDLEERLVQKLVELETLNDPPEVQITWIDKAVSPVDPYFPPGIIAIIGLSFSAAILGSLLVMVVLLEVKSPKSNR